MRLVILFSILFIGMLWGTVSLYCIEKKPIGVSIIVSFFFMIFFGGIALFQYIAFAPKLYVYGNKIVTMIELIRPYVKHIFRFQ